MIKCKTATNPQPQRFFKITSRVDKITSIPVEPLEVISFLVFSVREKDQYLLAEKKCYHLQIDKKICTANNKTYFKMHICI